MDAPCGHGRDFREPPERNPNSAADLTPYAVKVCYPQDLRVEEAHVVKALSDMKKVYDFAANELNKMRVSGTGENADKEVDSLASRLEVVQNFILYLKELDNSDKTIDE